MISRQSLFRFLLLLSLLPLAACGNGEGGGSGSCDFDSLEAVTVDADGTWCITDTSSSSNFECDGEVQVFEIEVTISGNTITAVTPGGTFTGTISGNEVKWNGSFGEDGGTTTVSCADITVSSGGASLSGTSTWSFSDGTGFSCSGTSTVSGTKGPCPN